MSFVQAPPVLGNQYDEDRVLQGFLRRRATALALLVDHAAWALAHHSDPLPAAAARRFAHSGVDLIGAGVLDDDDAALLARDALG
jgi:hypothetical protein